MNIKFVSDNTEKQRIATEILHDLPEWFGIEESTKEYIDNVIHYPFVTACISGENIGFYSLREENCDTLDMYVLGIKQKFHHQGVGSKMQNFVNKYAENNGYKYLIVLTLAEKVQNKEYLQTRAFYIKNGFTDLYQNDRIFDKYNPCQIMIKTI